MRSSRRRWLAGALIVIAGLCLYFGNLLFRNNLHSVIPGEIYRSAQPTPDDLGEWAEDLALRSVINLKGDGRERSESPEDEARRAAELGLEVRLVRMSAQRWPAPGELDRLMDALASSPRPLLLHCSAGVDRTGLGAAVALLMAGREPAEARRQFSLEHGYPGSLFGSNLPGVIDAYQAWLVETGEAHHPEAFREWVHTDYLPGYYAAGLELLTPTRQLEAGQKLSFAVRVTNLSPLGIPLQCDDGGVFLSIVVTSLRDLDERGPYQEGRRMCRPGNALLEPQTSTRLELDGFTLPNPGTYEIKIDLVDQREGHWFETMGSQAIRRELTAR